MTIPDPVRQHAEARPDAPALTTGAETWTWADLDARVGGVAARLAAGPERVAVRAETSPGLVVLVLAALRAERLLVPVSTRWTGAAVADALARLGLDTIHADDEVEGVETRSLADLRAVSPAPTPGLPAIPLDRRFTVVHTSGSTGTPKAIVHSVGNHVWSARGVIEALDVSGTSRWLLALGELNSRASFRHCTIMTSPRSTCISRMRAGNANGLSRLRPAGLWGVRE